MFKHITTLVVCLFFFSNQGQAQHEHSHTHQHDHNQRDLTDYVNFIASQTNEDYYDSHDHELWHYYMNRPHPNVAAIETYFNDAAAEFGVPADLLKAIGQVENNWTQIGPSIDQGWGIMHLVENRNVHTLLEAAELIGVSTQILKDDPQQNIRGGAALLAKYAGPDVVGNNDIARWFDACKSFSGLHQEVFQELQAQTYFDRLKSGNTSSTVWGETITIVARPDLVVPVVQRNQSPQDTDSNNQITSADYGPAISNLTPCNYGTGRNTSIDTWVNHWIGVGTYAGAISWFHTCRPDAPSSAHFVIRSSDGEITQVVGVANTAYHAGASGYNNNGRSIGIEHEVTTSNPDLWNSVPMLEASTTMACHFAGIYNIPPTRSLPGIREHHEMPGTSTQCAGTIPWTTWMDMFTTCLGVDPPAGLDCASAVNITCGVTYSGAASTAPSNVDAYACNTWTETGPERIHKVTSPGSGTLTAALSNYTGDLDVYILGSCNPDDCLGTVNSDSAVFDNAVAGQVYYIVVDADDGSGGAYDLLVTCPTGGPTAGLDCSNAVPLTCGVTYSGPASTAASNVEAYACNTWTEAGPERVHTVEVLANGTLTASLSNYTGDLDVYILGSCDPADCVGTVNSDSAVLDNAIAGQTYYIVVDADDGSGSAYDLIVDCPPAGLICTNAVPLTCGETYSGAASTAPSYVDAYACNTWTETGPERVHSIVAPADGTLTAALTNYTGDLDVYILGSCNPDDCLGTVSSDFAVLENAVAGQTYYLVVDADDGSGGAYDITVTCPEVPVPNLDCTNAVALECGVTYSGAASTADSNVGLYSCNAWPEPGPERVHTVVAPEDGLLSATISNFTGDLDVFILSACDSLACLAVGDLTAELTTAVAGTTYYIVVDGYDGSGSSYDLLVTCGEPEVGFSCTNAVALTCGVLHSEPATTASSNVTTYSCNGWIQPGPERVHTVVATSETITATISNFTGDLDVYILSACDTTACVAAGDLGATLLTAVPGTTYYIVVEGYDGSGSAYDIIVDCEAPVLDCSGAVALTCGVPYSGAESTASSNVSLYSCNVWDEAGPERVHTVVAGADGSLSATISNFTGDLDVFILGSCDASDCLVAADSIATLAAAVAGTTYYIVVDGYDGSGSAYDLLVTCEVPPPVCEDHIMVSGSYGGNETFKAIHSVTSDATFTSGAVIEMYAADSIILQNGFTIEAGAEATIYFGECQ